MSPHGARPVSKISDVVVYLRERSRNITKLDLKIHSLVLPRDLTYVRELHYRFVNGNIVGECKVWVYSNIALILDYWCSIAELYERLLRYVINELKLYYRACQIYLHALRTEDDEERKFLGKALRSLGFIMLDNEYAVLTL